MPDLNEALQDAQANGLTGLTLWRVGTSTIQWQASSRWRGREGYSVHIDPDPAVAVEAALRAGVASQVGAPPASAVSDPSVASDIGFFD
ncbi:MAG: hypothetical protein WAP03_27910 [Methylorubrum rhodinum]|uniref:hypothetical protein n=1 Tax=Methylorubrum rhodinum TaxID=29428 RepID=UPI003BAFEF46